MLPFYLLLALTVALLVDLLRRLFLRAQLRGAPFTRQSARGEDEPDWLAALTAAAGPGYQVWPMVAAASLLRPVAGLRRGQRTLARRLLREGVLDFVLAARDGFPLCVVQLVPVRASRARRGALDALVAACAAAGLPVVALPADAPPARAALAKLVSDAMALAERHEVVAPPPELDGDEEDALARLSAVMAEPDATAPARG